MIVTAYGRTSSLSGVSGAITVTRSSGVPGIAASPLETQEMLNQPLTPRSALSFCR